MTASTIAVPPPELAALRQWVGWRLEQLDGRPKPAKVPYTTGGRRADTTDPATWLAYDEAQALGLDGVGFVFAEADPFVGVDLDGCRDPASGEIEPWARGLIQQLGGYAEVSPSGTGVHVIGRGTLPPGAKHRWYPVPGDASRAIEVYDAARYFTFTGQPLDGRAALGDLGVIPQPAAVTGEPESLAADDAGDTALLRQVAASRDGPALHRLFIAGETRPGKSESESDYELACLLARHTTDADQLRRLMRRSGLARPKWDRPGYLERTIRAAVRSVPARGSEPAEAPLDVTLADLLADPTLLQTPAALSPWLAWGGEFVLLAGREKDGKTTLAAADAVGAAKAGRAVLWVSAEEGLNRVVSRFHGLGEANTIVTLRRWPQSWEEVEATIARREPEVIYVDSLSSFLMAVEGDVPKPSEGERWQALALRFKRWAITGRRGVVVLAHAAKADGTYRGSTGIGAAPDTLITLRPVDGDPNARHLATVGRWGFPSRTLRYLGDERPGFEEIDAATAPRGGSKPDPLLSADRQQGLVYRALAKADGALTYGEWRTAAPVSKGTFEVARTKLEDREFARRDAETGKYALTAEGRRMARVLGWVDADF